MNKFYKAEGWYEHRPMSLHLLHTRHPESIDEFTGLSLRDKMAIGLNNIGNITELQLDVWIFTLNLHCKND